MSSPSPEPESTNSAGSDNGAGRVDPTPQPPMASPPADVGQQPGPAYNPSQPPYGYPQYGAEVPPIPPAPGPPLPGSAGYPSPPAGYPGYGQQPGYQPVGAGYGPGMPPPYPQRKKGKKGLIIGLSIGAVVLLLCCGCIGLGIWGFREVDKSAREDAQEVVGDYLGHLQNEDYDKAYDLLCDDLRGDESSSDFAERMAEPENRIDDFSVGDASRSTRNGVDYEVEVEITRADDVVNDEVDVVLEDNAEGKVCSHV